MLALANAIFELLYPNLKTQAVFTVPTRALANDKLSEWRARQVEQLILNDFTCAGGTF